MKPIAKKLEGKELEEKQRSLKEEVDGMFKFDNNLGVLEINADKIEAKTLSAILDLMIETRQLNNMLKDKSTVTYNVQFSLTNVKENHVVSSKKLISDFIPIIKELIYGDLIGESKIKQLDEKVSKIAMKNFK